MKDYPQSEVTPAPRRRSNALFLEQMAQADMASGVQLCAEHFSPSGWMRGPEELRLAYVKTIELVRDNGLASSTQVPPAELIARVWNETAHLRR